MTLFKKTALTLTAALLATSSVNAEIHYYTPSFDPLASLQVEQTAPVITETAKFKLSSQVAVARIDQGKMIPTPYGEVVDWEFLDRRVETQFNQLGYTAYYVHTPEIEFDQKASDNTIDEIRLAAMNEGYDFVLIYGVGKDAGWASFGGKALVETGLTIHEDCASWEQANAKALLIDSRSGEVLGAATADNIEFHIGELADRVEGLVRGLAGKTI